MSRPASPGPRPAWPWWVRAALKGAPTRRRAVLCRAAALGLAVGFGAAAFWRPEFAGGMVVMLVAALLYDRALAWVDRHDAWGA